MSNPTLSQARADMATVETELEALNVAKADAIRSAGPFAKWKSEHDAKLAERERLTSLIEALERESAVAEAEEAKAALRKRHADRKAANEGLARRIRADLKRANTILLSLVRDVAAAQLEDAEINDHLPEGLAPLIPADHLARSRPALDAAEIRRDRVWMWADVRSGLLIGDQSIVIDDGEGRGHFGEGHHYRNCRAVLVDQISRHPATRLERADPLWLGMKLPQPDGPNFVFDGAGWSADSALAAIARAARANKETAERPVEIELKPVLSVAAEREVAA